MSTTITQEEREALRRAIIKSQMNPNRSDSMVALDEILTRLLNAIEQSEAQLAAALQVNAKSQAEVTADVLNAMMAGITGQKESVRVEVEGFQCPYCNEISKTIEAATAHDAICPKHPAVIRAEALERDLNRVKAAGIEAMRRTEQAEARAEKAEAQRNKDLAHRKFEFDRAENAEAEVVRLRAALQTAESALSLAHHRGQYDLVDKALSKVCTALYGNKNADEEAARRAVAAGED